MANNRLLIEDSETGERFVLAKSTGNGWWVWYGESLGERIRALNQWLELRDVHASYGNTGDGPSKLRLVTENEDKS